MKILNKNKANKYIIIKKYNIIRKRIKSKKKLKHKNIKLVPFFLKIIILIIILSKFILILFSKQKQNKNKNMPLNKLEIIDNYLSSIPSKYQKHKNLEKKRLDIYLSLKEFQNNSNDTLTLEIKSKLLREINKYTRGKDFSKVNSVFLTSPIYYGNTMIMINNIMYYSEIFGIKNIYFHRRYNWFLRNIITTGKFNISVVSSSKINCGARDTVCFYLYDTPLFFFLYSPEIIKPQIRIDLLKDEIRSNLPHIDIGKDDLVIHIRSGRLFTNDFNPFYSQPPLCFYQQILHKFKFKNIIMISQNEKNPVIGPLIKEFPIIIFKKLSLAKDIAHLVNAYNLVGSVSSFLTTTVKLNDNLRNFYEYDIYRKSEKFCQLHHDFFGFSRKFTIYKMIPSQNYKNEMFVWGNEPYKMKLMIEENCSNDFTKIPPNE